jgi:cobalt-zinc-cadmium efflux system protein
MSHHHDHDHEALHDGGHHHAPVTHNKAFAIGIALNSGFVVLEGVYGVLSNSMALVADAGHNLSDVLALALAWLASRMAQKPPSKQYTYGLRSSSILTALFNAMLLMAVSGVILWEAIQRFIHPQPVIGWTMIWVAAAGILVNGSTALMFMRGSNHDINIRGAYLHMASDAAVSASVVIAGLIIMSTGWLWIDPAVSVIVVLVIVWSTWDLMKDSIRLALHAVPPRVNAQAIREYLSSLPGVSEVHDLHIWGMSTTEVALTVHLVVQSTPLNDNSLVSTASNELRERFGIGHATIQIELANDPMHCPLAPEHVV